MVFCRKKLITFIFRKMMSHDLLVQMAYREDRHRLQNNEPGWSYGAMELSSCVLWVNHMPFRQWGCSDYIS